MLWYDVCFINQYRHTYMTMFVILGHEADLEIDADNKLGDIVI